MPNQNITISSSSGVRLSNIKQHATFGEPGAPQPPAADERRLLFASATPSGTQPLRVDLELRALQEALSSQPGEPRVVLAQAPAVDAASLHAAILRERPTVLHLAAHGLRGHGVLLESTSEVLRTSGPSSGGVGPLVEAGSWASALVSLFEQGANTVQGIVLTACSSADAAQALAQKVPWAVGSRNDVPDEAIPPFVRGFYQAFAAGRPTRDCHRAGQALVTLEVGIEVAQSFVLFER